MFSISWSRRFLECRHDVERSKWLAEAFLVERILVSGKPELRTAARIAGILEDRIDDVASQDAFWTAALTKLSRLRRLSLRDRENLGASEQRPRVHPHQIRMTVAVFGIFVAIRMQ